LKEKRIEKERERRIKRNPQGKLRKSLVPLPRFKLLCDEEGVWLRSDVWASG
jgi:hypothetical protein